jgi:hypothetical protein
MDVFCALAQGLATDRHAVLQDGLQQLVGDAVAENVCGMFGLAA